MIVNKFIKIKVNPNSRLYFNSIGYRCENFEIIEIKTLDLPKNSNIKILRSFASQYAHRNPPQQIGNCQQIKKPAQKAGFLFLKFYNYCI